MNLGILTCLFISTVFYTNLPKQLADWWLVRHFEIFAWSWTLPDWLFWVPDFAPPTNQSGNQTNRKWTVDWREKKFKFAFKFWVKSSVFWKHDLTNSEAQWRSCSSHAVCRIQTLIFCQTLMKTQMKIPTIWLCWNYMIPKTMYIIWVRQMIRWKNVNPYKCMQIMLICICKFTKNLSTWKLRIYPTTLLYIIFSLLL